MDLNSDFLDKPLGMDNEVNNDNRTEASAQSFSNDPVMQDMEDELNDPDMLSFDNNLPDDISWPSIPSIGAQKTFNIQNALDGLQAQKPSFQAKSAPVFFDWDATNADRYVQSDYYKEMGFDPFGDNETRYGERQTFGDIMENAFAGGGRLAWNTFVDGWAGWGRLVDALFSWDAKKIMGSEEELAALHKEQQDIFNKYAIFRTPESNEEIFNKQFLGDLVQQGGFAVGALGQFLSEELVTMGMSSFLKPVTGARSLMTFLRAGHTIDEAYKDAKRVGDIWKFTGTMRKFYDSLKPSLSAAGDVIKGVGELTPVGKRIAKAAREGATGWDIAEIGLSSLRRTVAEANMAFTEARMEAAGTYGELKDALYEQTLNNNGEVTTDDQLRIDHLSAEAAWDSFTTNAIVIATMNRLQLDNLIRTFGSDKRLTRLLAEEGINKGAKPKGFIVSGKAARDIVNEAGDVLVPKGGAYAQAFERGSLGALGKVKTIARNFGKKTAAWELAKSSRNLFKWEVTEGLQELLQDTSNKAITDYYTDLYNGEAGDMMASIQEGLNAQLSAEGGRTFLLGSTMGLVMSPISTGIRKGVEWSSTTKEQRQASAQSRKMAIDTINAFYANPKNYAQEWIANTNVQNRAAQKMEEALENRDKYTYEHTKDAAFPAMVTALKELKMLPAFLDTLEELPKNFTKEQFQEMFMVDFNDDNRRNAEEYVQNIIKEVKGFSNRYDELWEEYHDILKPDEYAGEDREKVLLARRAFNEMIKWAASNEYRSKRASERSTAVLQEAATIPGVGNMAYEIFPILSDDRALAKELETLQMELDADRGATIMTDELKERIQLKEKQVQILTAFAAQVAFFDAETKSKGKAVTQIGDLAERRKRVSQIQQLTGDYVNTRSAANRRDILLPEKSAEKLALLLYDHRQLNKDQKDAHNAFMLITSPKKNRDFFIKIYGGLEALQQQKQNSAQQNQTGATTGNNTPTTPGTPPTSVTPNAPVTPSGTSTQQPAQKQVDPLEEPVLPRMVRDEDDDDQEEGETAKPKPKPVKPSPPSGYKQGDWFRSIKDNTFYYVNSEDRGKVNMINLTTDDLIPSSRRKLDEMLENGSLERSDAYSFFGQDSEGMEIMPDSKEGVFIIRLDPAEESYFVVDKKMNAIVIGEELSTKEPYYNLQDAKETVDTILQLRKEVTTEAPVSFVFDQQELSIGDTLLDKNNKEYLIIGAPRMMGGRPVILLKRVDNERNHQISSLAGYNKKPQPGAEKIKKIKDGKFRMKNARSPMVIYVHERNKTAKGKSSSSNRAAAIKRMQDLLRTVPLEELTDDLSITVKRNKDVRSTIADKGKATENASLLLNGEPLNIAIQYQGEPIGYVTYYNHYQYQDTVTGKAIPTPELTVDQFAAIFDISIGDPQLLLSQFQQAYRTGEGIYRVLEQLLDEQKNASSITIEGDRLKELFNVEVTPGQYDWVDQATTTLQDFPYNNVEGERVVLVRKKQYEGEYYEQEEKAVFDESLPEEAAEKILTAINASRFKKNDPNKDAILHMGSYVAAIQLPNKQIRFIDLEVPTLSASALEKLTKQLNQELAGATAGKLHTNFNRDVLGNVFIATRNKNYGIYLQLELNEQGDIVINYENKKKQLKDGIVVQRPDPSQSLQFDQVEDLITALNEAIKEHDRNRPEKERLDIVLQPENFKQHLPDNADIDTLSTLLVKVSPDVVRNINLFIKAKEVQEEPIPLFQDPVPVGTPAAAAAKESTTPAKPVKSTTAVEPTGPVEPTEPIELAKPVDSTTPIDSAEPVEPTKPVTAPSTIPQQEQPSVSQEQLQEDQPIPPPANPIIEAPSIPAEGTIQLVNESSQDELKALFDERLTFEGETEQTLALTRDELPATPASALIAETKELQKRIADSRAEVFNELVKGKGSKNITKLLDAVEQDPRVAVLKDSLLYVREQLAAMAMMTTDKLRTADIVHIERFRDWLKALPKKVINAQQADQLSDYLLNNGITVGQLVAQLNESEQTLTPTSPATAPFKQYDTVMQRLATAIREHLNSQEVDSLFYEVDSKKYNNAPVIDNRFLTELQNGVPQVALKELKIGEDWVDDNGRVFKTDVYLSESKTAQLAAAITARVLRRISEQQQDLPTALNAIINEYAQLYNQRREQYTKRLQQENGVASYFAMLPELEKLTYLFTEGKQQIINVVTERLQSIDHRYELLEAERNDLIRAGGVRAAVQQREQDDSGGIRLMPKELLVYMSSITVPVTGEFGNRFFENGELLVEAIDVPAVYSGLQKAAANTENIHEALMRMFDYGLHNEQSRAFMRRFMNDVGLELTDEDYTLLNTGKEDLFMMVVKAFQHYTQDSLLFIKNIRVKRTFVNYPSQYSASRSQVYNWQNAYNTVFEEPYLKLYEEEKEDYLREAVFGLEMFRLYANDTKISDKTLWEVATLISRRTKAQLGISFHPRFIAYSLATARESGNRTVYQRQLVNWYTSVKPLLDEDAMGIAVTVLSKNSPFYVNVDQQELDVMLTDDKPAEVQTQMEKNVKRLFRLAYANAFFDETVHADTYVTATGAKRNTHQWPDYYLVKTHELRNILEEEGGREKLLQDPFYKKNHLLANPRIGVVTQELKLYTINGMQVKIPQKVWDQDPIDGSIARYMEKGVDFERYTDRDFVLNMLDLYFDVKTYKMTPEGKPIVVDENVLQPEAGDVEKEDKQTESENKTDEKSNKEKKTEEEEEVEQIEEEDEEENKEEDKDEEDEEGSWKAKKKEALPLDPNLFLVARHALPVTGEDGKAYTVRLPISKAVAIIDRKIRLTPLAIDAMMADIAREFNRIKKVHTEIRAIAKEKKAYETNKTPRTIVEIEGYHTPGPNGAKPRGITFFRTGAMLGKLAETLEQEAAERGGLEKYNKAITKRLQTYWVGENGVANRLLQSFVDMGIVSPGLEGRIQYRNYMLPFHIYRRLKAPRGSVRYYTTELMNFIPGEIPHNLAQIVVNDYLNMQALDQWMFGDDAKSLQNLSDRSRHAKGAGTKGVSLHFDITAPSLGITHPGTNSHVVHVRELSSNEGANEQMWITTKALRYMLLGAGKLNHEQAALLDRLEAAETNETTPLPTLQLTYFDGARHIEAKTTILTKAFTSYQDAQGKWKPLQHRSELHQLREKLERFEKQHNSLGIAVSLGASKGEKANVADRVNAITDWNFQPLDNKYWRLVHMEAGKKATDQTMIDNGVAQQFLLSQQNAALPAALPWSIVGLVDQQATTVGEVKKLYLQYMADRLRSNYESIPKNIEAILQTASKQLESTGANSQLLSLLSLDESGKPAYNVNLPVTVDTFTEQFFQYFTQQVLQEKIPGRVLNITAAQATPIIREVLSVDANGQPKQSRVITTAEVKRNPALYTTAIKAAVTIEEGETATTTPSFKGLQERLERGERTFVIDELRANMPIYALNKEGAIQQDEQGNDIILGYYDEMIAPPANAEIAAMADKWEVIPEALSMSFGTFAPAANTRPFATLKLVDLLPATHGNAVVLANDTVKEQMVVPGRDMLYIAEIDNRENDRAKLNNLILQTQIQLANSIGQTEQAKPKPKQAFSMEPVLKVIESFKEKFPLMREQLEGVQTGIEGMAYKKDVFHNERLGSQADGNATRIMAAYSFLNDAAVALRPSKTKKKEKGVWHLTINGIPFNSYEHTHAYNPATEQFDGESISEALSALSMAVQGKTGKRFTSQLGLNAESLNMVGNMVSMGVPLEWALSFIMQPAIQTYYQRVSFVGSPVKVAKELNRGKHLEWQKMQDNIRRKLDGKTPKPVPLTTDLMQSNIVMHGRNLEEEYNILNEFIELKEQTAYFNVVGELLRIMNAPTANKFMEFKRYVERLQLKADDISFENTDVPFDLRSLIMGNKAQHSLLAAHMDIYDQLDRLAQQQLLASTPLAKQMKNAVIANLDVSDFLTADFNNEINQDQVSFIGIKAYLKALEDQGQHMRLSSLTNALIYNEIADNEPKEFMNIIEVLKAVRALHPDNYFAKRFLHAIGTHTVTNEGEVKNNEHNTGGINKVEINTWVKLSRSRVAQFQEDFLKIYRDKRTNHLAWTLFHYLLVKDGGQIRSGTFLSYIPSFMFKDLSTALTKGMDLFTRDASDQEFQKVFGATRDQLLNQFATAYLDHAGTGQYIPERNIAGSAHTIGFGIRFSIPAELQKYIPETLQMSEKGNAIEINLWGGNIEKGKKELKEAFLEREAKKKAGIKLSKTEKAAEAKKQEAEIEKLYTLLLEKHLHSITNRLFVEHGRIKGTGRRTPFTLETIQQVTIQFPYLVKYNMGVQDPITGGQKKVDIFYRLESVDGKKTYNADGFNFMTADNPIAIGTKAVYVPVQEVGSADQWKMGKMFGALKERRNDIVREPFAAENHPGFTIDGYLAPAVPGDLEMRILAAEEWLQENASAVSEFEEKYNVKVEVVEGNVVRFLRDGVPANNRLELYGLWKEMKAKKKRLSDSKNLSLNNEREKTALTKRKTRGVGQTKRAPKEVRYNGTDVIGSRSRPQSEKDAGKTLAKEKIKNREDNNALWIANKYATHVGRPPVGLHTFKPSDPVLQTEIARTFQQLKAVTSPDYKEGPLEREVYTSYRRKYPELLKEYGIRNYKELVKKAYAQLAKESIEQYNFLVRYIKVSYHDGDKNYESSAEMLDDVHNFGHLWVFRGGEDHPMLGSKTADQQGLTINDKLRAVHDFFGHAIEGYEFGKNGEENAWIEHSKMFSTLAQIALSTETRGQNSVVNYSGINEVALEKIKLGSALKKKGLAENNQEAMNEGQRLLDEGNQEFIYAPQKSIVLPAHQVAFEQYLQTDETASDKNIVAKPAPVWESAVPIPEEVISLLNAPVPYDDFVVHHGDVPFNELAMSIAPAVKAAEQDPRYKELVEMIQTTMKEHKCKLPA